MKKLDTIKDRLDSLSGKIDSTVNALNDIQAKLELERLRWAQREKDSESS